ncbi:MAG TPA: acyl-CoA dehydrogenase family protein, partial [Actinomycetota bacterium]|nr:acyl-CoA dehydrogenase family protein [Actinomycetota bacterium]
MGSDDHRVRFRPLDPLDVDALLSDEERAVRDTTRDWVKSRVLPEIAEWFERGEIPSRELAKELGGMGLLGMHLSGYGTAGASAVMYGLAVHELEYGDSGVRSLVSVQGSLAMFPIWKFGSDEQKDEWLPRMASGDAIGCFGLTEPDIGSDPASMRTSARRDGDDWVLSGTKMWITNGGIADVAVVWARTDDGVRGFVVPTEAPGFSTNEIERKISLRASVTSELVLDDVRLPSSAMLPGVRGMRGPLSCLNEARYGIVWGAMGAARACYDAALEYATTRHQFGKPIGGFQLTQRKLVDMAVEIGKGMLLALHLGRMKDEGRAAPEH